MLDGIRLISAEYEIGNAPEIDSYRVTKWRGLYKSKNITQKLSKQLRIKASDKVSTNDSCNKTYDKSV